MKHSLLFAILLLVSSTSFSQTAKEVGIRFSNFDNFEALYKTGKDADHLWRIRSLVGSFSVIDNGTSENTSAFSLGLSAGRENHIALADRFDFIHGIEGGLTYSSANTSGGSDPDAIQFRLGYLLGGVYDLSDQFKVGAEIIPGAFYTSVSDSFSNNQNAYGFSFNSNSAALTLTYAFTKN